MSDKQSLDLIRPFLQIAWRHESARRYISISNAIEVISYSHCFTLPEVQALCFPEMLIYNAVSELFPPKQEVLVH